MIETTHLLAGAGGDLAGFAEAGFTPITAVNHLWPAIATIRANYPAVRGIVEDVVRLNMRRLVKTPVLVGSPICTESSPSGRRGTHTQIHEAWDATRATAWCLLRAAEVQRPEVVCGENVLDFATRWVLFEPWVHCWEALGYVPKLVPVNSAHLSGPGNPAAPQLRERLLFVFARPGIDVDVSVSPAAMCPACGPVTGVRVWKRGAGKQLAGFMIGKYGTYYYGCPNLRCGMRVEPVTAPMAPGVDWNAPTTFVGDGHPNRREFTPYVPNTRRRIQAGLDALGGAPFVAICRKNKTYESLDGPVATVTAGGNHHMLVIPTDGTVDGCRVRMFHTAEKAYAQRFRPGYQFVTGGTSSVGGRLVGNAVSVNVGHWLASRVKYALAA